MTTKLVPLIFCGTAIGCIRRGEIGLAIAVICGIAVMVLVDWIFDEIRQNDERKRRIEDAERRRSRY